MMPWCPFHLCSLQPTGKMLVEPLVYTQRLELMRNVCREDALRNLSHTAVSKFVLDRIFVCDKHKILFCQTPKVGNTQWKKVLIVLNGVCPSCPDLGVCGEGVGGAGASSQGDLGGLATHRQLAGAFPFFGYAARHVGS